jgi:hypothetical protein
MIKELEDYTWFPKALRRWQLQFVGAVSVWTKLYQPLTAIVQQLIDENKLVALQDVCSGSGKPAVYVHQQLKATMPLLLTDLFPEEQFVNQPGIAYSLQTVDALQMETVNHTGYTMFNAFHHFNEMQQRVIIQKMADAKAPVLIAEILEPGIFNVIKIIFTATIVQLLTAPFVQPFSPARLLFTYIIPVNLFTVAYDGVISVVKSKTVAQYNNVLKGISTRSYSISVNRLNNWKGNVVYIKGSPINT